MGNDASVAQITPPKTMKMEAGSIKLAISPPSIMLMKTQAKPAICRLMSSDPIVSPIVQRNVAIYICRRFPFFFP